MTPDDQEARSLRFEPSASVIIRPLASGNWAMYAMGGITTPFWIGPSDDLIMAYVNRPPYTPHSQAPSQVPIGKPKIAKGLDLTKLEIDI